MTRGRTLNVEYGRQQIVVLQGKRVHRYLLRPGAGSRWNRNPADMLGDNLTGAGGEFALATVTRWPIQDIKGDCRWDVGRAQVRTAHHPNTRLIVHPEDPDDDPYFHVWREHDLVFTIVGWCYGWQGKKWGELREYHPGRACLYVPNRMLRDLSEWGI